MAIHIRTGSDSAALRQASDLHYALERAQEQEQTQLILYLGTINLHFRAGPILGGARASNIGHFFFRSRFFFRDVCVHSIFFTWCIVRLCQNQGAQDLNNYWELESIVYTHQ